MLSVAVVLWSTTATLLSFQSSEPRISSRLMHFHSALQFLDITVEFCTPVLEVAALIAALFPSCQRQGNVQVTYAVTLTIEPQASVGSAPELFTMRARSVRGEEVFFGIRLRDFAGLLDWYVTSLVIEHLVARYWLLHAAALERAGFALLLPAPSGSGKSTLAAALAFCGYSYLSDEVAVVDRTTLRVLPFPKNLGLRSGGFQALIQEFPGLNTMLENITIFKARRGLLLSPHSWVLPDADEAFPVPLIVFPEYELGRSDSALLPLDRGKALLQLLQQRYGWAEGRDFGTFAMAMTELVRRARCYALRVGTLRSAVACIDRLLAGDEPGPTPAQADLLAAQLIHEGR